MKWVWVWASDGVAVWVCDVGGRCVVCNVSGCMMWIQVECLIFFEVWIEVSMSHWSSAEKTFVKQSLMFGVRNFAQKW